VYPTIKDSLNQEKIVAGQSPMVVSSVGAGAGEIL